MGRADKPMAMLEAALDAAKDRPRASASIAAAVSVVGVFVLFSSKKVPNVMQSDDAISASESRVAALPGVFYSPPRHAYCTPYAKTTSMPEVHRQNKDEVAHPL